MTTAAPLGEHTDGRAVAALAFGVAGIVFPIVPAVVAIWLGVSARGAIRRDTTLGGEWMATCGVILGAVELALTALAVIAFVGFFAIVSVHATTP